MAAPPQIVVDSSLRHVQYGRRRRSRALVPLLAIGLPVIALSVVVVVVLAIKGQRLETIDAPPEIASLVRTMQRLGIPVDRVWGAELDGLPMYVIELEGYRPTMQHIDDSDKDEFGKFLDRMDANEHRLLVFDCGTSSFARGYADPIMLQIGVQVVRGQYVIQSTSSYLDRL